VIGFLSGFAFLPYLHYNSRSYVIASLMSVWVRYFPFILVRSQLLKKEQTITITLPAFWIFINDNSLPSFQGRTALVLTSAGLLAAFYLTKDAEFCPWCKYFDCIPYTSDICDYK
jgi:hypothetical protein